MTAKDLYENSRSWLQFAETKNGFSLAFCGAIVAAQTSLLSSAANEFKPYILMSIGLVMVGAIFSLVSFVPQVAISVKEKDHKPHTDRIIYFAEIARQGRGAYIKRACELLDVKTTDSLSAELLGECHALSIITVRKLWLFYVSVVVSGLGVILPVVAALIRSLST